MKKTILLVLVSVIILSCKKDDSISNQFRLRNDTNLVIDSIYVRLGKSNNSYTKLDPGAITDYKLFNDSGYPYIRISTGGKTTEFQIALTDNNPPAEKTKTKLTSVEQTCIISINNTGSINIGFQVDK